MQVQVLQTPPPPPSTVTTHVCCQALYSFDPPVGAPGPMKALVLGHISACALLQAKYQTHFVVRCSQQAAARGMC